MKKYAIVGFGCAGYQALSALRECDADGEIHVFSELREPPSNPMLTTYYSADRIPYEAMFPFGNLDEIRTRYSSVLHMEHPVTQLDVQNRTLCCGNITYGPFNKILLATGAIPIVPPLGVKPGKRVLTMRTAADAMLLRERLKQLSPQNVTVIGASMVGIKIVELCLEAGLECTLVDMADRIFPLAAFYDVSTEIQRRLIELGVNLSFGNAVVNAEESNEGVTTHFADGSTVTSELLVLCIGTRARTELARSAGIEVNRGIVVNDSMETSVPGIYAAGDCCEGLNIMTGGHQIIGLWANAACQGRTAGRCMAETPCSFSGNILHNITHFLGMDFISFGDVNARGKVYTIGNPSDSRYVKAIVADGELRCVNMLDSYHISGVIKNYIMNRFTGNKAPLPTALRGLLAQEGFTNEFLTLFEGGNDE